MKIYQNGDMCSWCLGISSIEGQTNNSFVASCQDYNGVHASIDDEVHS